MIWIIALLTVLLVIDCLLLILLVLVQLPKKEAGMGIAFGGAATDALFGAGSGNALTKMTKYSAGIFVGLSILLSVLNMHYSRAGARRLERELSRQASSTTPALPITTPNPVASLPPPSNATVATPN